MLSGSPLPLRLLIWLRVLNKAPPVPYVAPIYDWTGFYIGGNGGWGQGHNCVDFVERLA